MSVTTFAPPRSEPVCRRRHCPSYQKYFRHAHFDFSYHDSTRADLLQPVRVSSSGAAGIKTKVKQRIGEGIESVGLSASWEKSST